MKNFQNPLHKFMYQNDKNNKGIDLSGSTKDSGTDVKFKEYRISHPYYPETSKIIRWVIKYSGGLVKDEKQASYVLFGFVVAAAVIILIVLIFSRSSSSEIRKIIPKKEYIDPPKPWIQNL